MQPVRNRCRRHAALAIGLFCYTGLFVLPVLFEQLGLVTDLTDGLFALPGLAGLGMTVLSLVGGGFYIAGPRAARGLAIATVAVAAVHALLTLIGYSEVTKGTWRRPQPPPRRRPGLVGPGSDAVGAQPGTARAH